MSKRAQALASALVPILLFGACREADVTESRLDEAEALWHERGVTRYLMEVRVTDRRGLERRVEVTVRDGAIVEATIREGDGERSLREAQAAPYTVEGLFRTLFEELEADQRRFLRAWFDAERGYPERIELGPVRDGPPEAGARRLHVERFEVLR